MRPEFGDDSYQACVEWVKNNAKPMDIVVSQTHSYLYLMRGPYCLPYFCASTANEFVSYLDEHHVKYVVVLPVQGRYTCIEMPREAERMYPERFRRVFGEAGAHSYVVEYVPQNEER
jgi:hypothetical protein